MKLGRGSPNTVGPMLEEWFAMLAPRLGVGPAEQGGLPAALHEAMREIWQVALQSATEQVQQDGEAQREQLAQANAQLEAHRQALAVQERAAQEREQLRQAVLDRAQRQHDEAQAQIAQLQEAMAAQNANLEQARGSIARLVQEKDSAEREATKRLDALSEERAKLQQRAEANERRLLEEVDRARQEAKTASKSLTEAQRSFEERRGALEAGARALQAQLQDAQLQVITLTERLAASERRAADLQGMLATPASPARARPVRAAQGARKVAKPRKTKTGG